MSRIRGQHHIKMVMITDVIPTTRNHLAGTSLRHQ